MFPLHTTQAALAWTGAAFSLGTLIASIVVLSLVRSQVNRCSRIANRMAGSNENILKALDAQGNALSSHYKAMGEHLAAVQSRSLRSTHAGSDELENRLQAKVHAIRPRIEAQRPEEPQPC